MSVQIDSDGVRLYESLDPLSDVRINLTTTGNITTQSVQTELLRFDNTMIQIDSKEYLQPPPAIFPQIDGILRVSQENGNRFSFISTSKHAEETIFTNSVGGVVNEYFTTSGLRKNYVIDTNTVFNFYFLDVLNEAPVDFHFLFLNESGNSYSVEIILHLYDSNGQDITGGTITFVGKLKSFNGQTLSNSFSVVARDVITIPQIPELQQFRGEAYLSLKSHSKNTQANGIYVGDMEIYHPVPVNVIINESLGIGGEPTSEKLEVTDGNIYINADTTGEATLFMRASDGGATFDTTKTALIGINDSGVGIKEGAIVIDTNDKVGIGTPSPSGKLNVIPLGTIGGGGSLQNAGLLIGSTSNGIGIDANEITQNGDSFYLSSTSNDIVFRTSSGTERMRILSSGNVGIGTPSPSEKLDVNGTMIGNKVSVLNGTTQDSINYTFGNHHGNSYYKVQYHSGNIGDNELVGKIGMDYNNFAGTQFDNCYIKFYKNGGATSGGYLTFTTNVDNEKMRIDSNGRVGIGTTSAGSYGVLAVNGGIASLNATGIPTNTGANLYMSGGTGSPEVGVIYVGDGSGWKLKFSKRTGNTNTELGSFNDGGRFTCVSLTETSDARIKKNIFDLDDLEALNIIRQLKPKSYQYREINRTTNTVIGFIAQDVKEILPYAVSIESRPIQNFSSNCTIQNGTISFQDEVPLQIGDTINIADTFELSENVTITGIVNGSVFQTNLPNSYSNASVFHVSGIKVDDFHTMNKSVIFTIATAALQELDRHVQNLTAENNTLKQRLDTIEARLTSLESSS